MPKFKVPFAYSTHGTVEVEADDRGDAYAQVEGSLEEYGMDLIQIMKSYKKGEDIVTVLKPEEVKDGS